MKKIFIFILFLFLLTPLSAANASGLNNRVNELTYEEKENILRLLDACADVMHFDRDNYDFDTLMKYILCTHPNFAAVTNLSPETDIAGSGANDISIVKGDYIDNIVTSIFNLTPVHPPVNELVVRGYCYSGGLYYYQNAFNAEFGTEIVDLTEVYSLGGNVYYVVFSDIYYENNSASPEYSFAVIKKSSDLPYSLIRLGMGEKLLTKAQIIAYTPQKAYQNPRWQTAAPDYRPSGKLSLSTLAAIIFISSLIFIIGSAALIKELREK